MRRAHRRGEPGPLAEESRVFGTGRIGQTPRQGGNTPTEDLRDLVRAEEAPGGPETSRCPDVGVPNGCGIHHQWHHLQVARIGHSIRLDLNGRPAFRYEDPDPLPGGYVGVWTRNSGVLVPRVTIYQ